MTTTGIKTKFVLTMIVKNESKIMERCLESAKPFIDGVAIMDTGSSDDTKKIIENYCEKENIPCQITEQEFKDFGTNRTGSYYAAQKFVDNQTLYFLSMDTYLNRHIENRKQIVLDFLGLSAWSRNKTYALLLDADFILSKEDTLDIDTFKQSLDKACYQIPQVSHELTYSNTRLIRFSEIAICTGVTHEYWGCCTSESQFNNLNTIWIEDYGDGGCKQDKFERDERLLKAGLEKEPNNERYWFYLAQTYTCLGKERYEEAITAYLKRIEYTKGTEENWYAHFVIGKLYWELGKEQEAVHWLLKSYNMRPTRVEPLYYLTLKYREKPDQQHIAMLICNQAKKISYPKDDILFVEHPIYYWKLLYEMSILCYYTKEFELGRQVCEKLRFTRELNGFDNALNYEIHKNECFYLKDLKRKAKLQLTLPSHITQYYPTNPSLVRVSLDDLQNKIKIPFYTLLMKNEPELPLPDYVHIVCVRAVNYVVNEHLEYTMPMGNIETRNFIQVIDFQINKVLIQFELKDTRTLKPRQIVPHDQQILGMEDCKLFLTQDYELWCSFTSLDHNLTRDVQIGVAQLEFTEDKKDLKTYCLQVSKCSYLEKPDPNRAEKNWLPFKSLSSTSHSFVYSIYPLVIKEYDLTTGKCLKDINISSIQDLDYDGFRGSAGPLPFGDGYLLVAHEVTMLPKGRQYLHRFIWLDSELKMKRMSFPFFLFTSSTNVQFCGGISYGLNDSTLLLSIGKSDHEAYVFTVKIEEIKKMLKVFNPHSLDNQHEPFLTNK